MLFLFRWITDYQYLRRKYSSLVLFINSLKFSVFVSLIRVWQKNIRKPWLGLFSCGHPTKHGRRETEGKSWCFRLWIIQRGDGPAERAGQKLKDQPTCQVLGDKFVRLIMSMIISLENVPLCPAQNNSSPDIFLTVLGFVKLWLTSWSREDSYHIFTWPLPLQPAWFTSWVVLSNYSRATIWMNRSGNHIAQFFSPCTIELDEMSAAYRKNTIK